MEAIILAGGFGTRLRMIVDDVPKPMAPINGKPFLEILLRSLSKKGIARAILSVGYRADQIIGHFGDSFCGIDLAYEVETSPLGTGGAIKAAMHRCEGDVTYVLNGDTFLDFDPSAIEECWLAHGEPVLTARRVEDATRYETLEVSGDCLLGFRQRGVAGCGLINAGCYLLPVNLVERMPHKAPFSFETDVLYHDSNAHPYRVVEVAGAFIDIGIPEDYSRAQGLLDRYCS